MDVEYFVRDSKIREIIDISGSQGNRNYIDYEDYIGYIVNDSKKRVHTNFAESVSLKKKIQRAARSSLSLVLQKASKTQIFEGYSIGSRNFELQNKTEDADPNNKPTIKITVIPKKNQNQVNSKNKIKQNKKINTPRHFETSIATKKVFVVVSGKNKKVYEIKASNRVSENFYDVKVENKRFPSKMDKKKKKSLKIEETLDEERCSDTNCYYRDSKEDIDLTLEDEDPTGSSRVKIVGRIGLNENDKYVMRCAATVNGQPVKTNYVPFTNVNPSKPDYNIQKRKDTKTVPFSFSFCNDEENESILESTNTQAIQVTPLMGLNLTNVCPTTDRNTQCNLCELCNITDSDNFKDPCKSITLNRSTSPLVVISVYPKSELNTCTINTVGNNTSVHRFDTPTYQPDQNNETVRPNNLTVNTELHNVKEISQGKTSMPRCCPCDTATHNGYKTTNEEIKTHSKKMSKNNKATKQSIRSPTSGKRSIKIKEPEMDYTDNKTSKLRSQSPSPNRLKNEKVTKKVTDVSKQSKKSVSVGTSLRKTEANKQPMTSTTPRSKSRVRDKSPGPAKESGKTSKAIGSKRKSTAKRILISNDESDICCSNTVLRKNLPKNDVSKVSVNIDGEKEFYDVIFEKGIVTTDLIVKRTGKENYSQKIFEENYEKNEELYSDSLENFFPLPKPGEYSAHKRSASLSFENENNAVLSLTTDMSRLNVRDSLEIGHRRDHSRELKSHGSKHRHKFSNEMGNNENFYASPKHFPGDDCILNPVERDREIRELLGVEKKRTDNMHKENTYMHELFRNKAIGRPCLFSDSLCNQDMPVSDIPVGWSLSSCSQNNEKEGNIYTQKRDEEKSMTDDEKHDLRNLVARAEIQQNFKVQNIVQVAIPTKQKTQFMSPNTIHYQNQDKVPALCRKQKTIVLSGKQYKKIKKMMSKLNHKKGKHTLRSSIVSIGSLKTKRRVENRINVNKNVQTEPFVEDLSKAKCNIPKLINVSKNVRDTTMVLFCTEETERTKERIKNEMRKVTSSVEIRYTSIAYSKIADCIQESPRIKDMKYTSNMIWKRRDSVETIFRGHKKTFTPNLGTSSISFLSGDVNSTIESLPTATKTRKPFLRRLMSCLVMRSGTTGMKLPVVPPQLPTLESSFDSYHISTSLGAIDMSSSIYDTTASFYTDHTIGVVNNKAKRGFLNSVRGFLSSKKN